MRGVPRVKRPQSRQPAYGEAVAIGVYLSIGASSRPGGRPKHAVCAGGAGADLHR